MTDDEHLLFVGEGWRPLLAELIAKLRSVCPEMEVLQCKEKFGGLRCYVTPETPEMKKLIMEAEAVAWKTCEDCGAHGRLRRGGWIRTLCDECEAKSTKQRT